MDLKAFTSQDLYFSGVYGESKIQIKNAIVILRHVKVYEMNNLDVCRPGGINFREE